MFKNFRVLRTPLLVVFALVLFSGVAYAFEGQSVNKVDVNIDGKVVSVNTTKTTVEEVLADIPVKLEKDDMVTPGLKTEITNQMKIEVSKAFMVTVSVDGAPRYLKVGKGEIGSAKQKIEAALKTETMLINAKETDPLVPDMKIELVTSYTEKDEEQIEIPFETVYVENAEVNEGTETVLAEGSPGISITVFESLYEGDKLISREPVETIVKVEKADRVIEVGTKPLKPVVPDVPELKLYYKKVMTLNATAYTTDRGDSGTHTATGERARVGLVAVDPNVIPLGTMLYVEGYGICRAADTGGAIKGNKIDLFFNTYNECVNFGRRNITVYVLEATRDELVVIEESDAKFVLQAA